MTSLRALLDVWNKETERKKEKSTFGAFKANEGVHQKKKKKKKEKERGRKIRLADCE